MLTQSAAMLLNLKKRRVQMNKHATHNPERKIATTDQSNSPAMLNASKLQKKAAEVGFDWPDIHAVFDKLYEEILELKNELQSNKNRQLDELGDILFCCVNLARHLDLDPSLALEQTNQKFTRRFAYIKAQLAKQGGNFHNATMNEMMALWEQAKVQCD